MSGKKQVGLRVDETLYRQFKEDVKNRRGRWQGVAGEELENAIREYLSGGSYPAGTTEANSIEDRLARIESAVGIESTDGGTHTSPEEIHTHTPTERPDPQTATEKKVLWLASCVEDRLGAGFEETPKQVLKDVVVDEYGFRTDTAKRYVSELVDHFGLVDHPTAELLVTPERKEELLDELREDAADLTEELDR